MIKRIIKFERENPALFVTVIFALVSFLLWIFSTDELDFSDLWLNLLAGFVASICTISVIDNILKRQKEKDELPFRIALYRDAQLFASKLISLWQEMYTQSQDDRSDIRVEELFSEEIIEKIFCSLDLEGHPNTIPKQDWFSYIEFNRAELVSRGNQILDRYVTIAEPELFYAIHHLVNDSTFVGLLQYVKQTRTVDVRNRIPRHPLLLSYTMKPRAKDYEAIGALFTWCRTEYKKIKGKGKVYQIAERVVVVNPNSPPSSIMTQEKILRISREYDVWQKSKPTIQ